MLEFLKLGYNVLTPYGDCERYDFVAEVNGQFLRIQCKTSSLSVDKSYFEFSCRSSHRVAGKCVNEKYSADDVDLFATMFNGKCYLCPISECGSSKRLRLTPPLNGANRGVSFAKDYELEVMLAHYN